MMRDDVRSIVDIVKRRIQHRKRGRMPAGGKRVADVDDHLAQPLLVRFRLLELGNEPVDFTLLRRRVWNQFRFAMYCDRFSMSSSDSVAETLVMLPASLVRRFALKSASCFLTYAYCWPATRGISFCPANSPR